MERLKHWLAAVVQVRFRLSFSWHVIFYSVVMIRQDRSKTKQCELFAIEPCGVGIELECNSDGQWVIAAVRPGGPADLSKLINPGDIVLSVEWNHLQASIRHQISPNFPGLNWFYRGEVRRKSTIFFMVQRVHP